MYLLRKHRQMANRQAAKMAKTSYEAYQRRYIDWIEARLKSGQDCTEADVEAHIPRIDDLTGASPF